MLEIEIDGVLRDLRHLQEIVVTLPNKGKDNAALRVSIALGTHTVSQGCPYGQHDMFDENGRPRQFCEERYAFSLGLPELARRMVEQNYFCWESIDQNRSVHYAVIDIAPGRVLSLQDGEHQVIFFYLHPETKTHADVRMVVASCYRREMKFKSGVRRYNMHTLLRRCLFSQKRIPS